MGVSRARCAVVGAANIDVGGFPSGLVAMGDSNPGQVRLSAAVVASWARYAEGVDEDGTPIKVEDNERRFFEASWMHKYNGKYYFSYSTGDSHFLCYAIGDNPYGPFTYQGVLLDPVVGWTTHHSIVQYKGEWFLFYHDCVPSNDITHLRSLKVQRLFYNEDGTIQKVINE